MDNIKTLRILFIGDKNSGKSSIISSFLFNSPVIPKKPIIFGSYCRDVILNNQRLKVYVCDTSEEDEFLRCIEMSFLEADLIAICVDSSIKNGVEKAEMYVKATEKSNLPRVLCLTKIDLVREIDEEKLKAFTSNYNLNGYLKINALHNKSVRHAFEKMIEIALDEIVYVKTSCCTWCRKS